MTARIAWCVGVLLLAGGAAAGKEWFDLYSAEEQKELLRGWGPELGKVPRSEKFGKALSLCEKLKGGEVHLIKAAEQLRAAYSAEGPGFSSKKNEIGASRAAVLLSICRADYRSKGALIPKLSDEFIDDYIWLMPVAGSDNDACSAINALGEFGPRADRAIPAIRKAAGMNSQRLRVAKKAIEQIKAKE